MVTAYFKLSSFEAGADIKGHGRPTSHIPEPYSTISGLGLAVHGTCVSLFPHSRSWKGAKWSHFCQRDFIFVRHHRYICRKKRTRIEQAAGAGPFYVKATLVARRVFNLDHGEYEWVLKGARWKLTRENSWCKDVT